MRTCEDCGQPNDRGWSIGGNEARRYCLVCETARLFDKPRQQPKTYQRNRAHDREYHRQWRARRAVAALRGNV